MGTNPRYRELTGQDPPERGKTRRDQLSAEQVDRLLAEVAPERPEPRPAEVSPERLARQLGELLAEDERITSDDPAAP